jgi:hypothetical protein
MSEMYDESQGYEPDAGHEGEVGWDPSPFQYDDGGGEDAGALDEDYIRSVMREELAPYVEQHQQMVNERAVQQGEQEVLAFMEAQGIPDSDFEKVTSRAAEILQAEVAKAVQEAERQGVSLDQVEPAELQAALQAEVVQAFEKATAEFVPRSQPGPTKDYSLARRYAQEGGPRPEVIRSMAADGYRRDEFGNVLSPGQQMRRTGGSA